MKEHKLPGNTPVWSQINRLAKESQRNEQRKMLSLLFWWRRREAIPARSPSSCRPTHHTDNWNAGLPGRWVLYPILDERTESRQPS